MRFGKSFFNGAVARSDVRRYWPVAAVYALIWIVALPLPLSRAGQHGYGAASPLQYMAEQTLETLPAAAVLACLFGAAVSMALTSYLMSAKAVSTLHAMPVTRTEVYLTHFTAGFLLYTAANVAVAVLSALATVPTVPWAALGWWLLLTELMGFFFMALGFFAAMLTGWLLLAPAVYGLLQFLALLVTALLRGLGNVFYYGYRSGPLPEAVIWLTPAVNLFRACEDAAVYSQTNGQSVLLVNAIDSVTVTAALIYTAAGAALLALGCVLYRVRRSEAAGDAVAYKPLRPAVKYLGALGCGIAGGLLLYGILEVNMLVSTVIITAIACFAIEMILKKSLRVFRCGWKGALLVCAAAAAVCLLVQLDLTGYQSRVPAEKDVTAVQVQFSGVPVYDVWLEDGQTIRAAQALHRRIVDEHSGAVAPEGAAPGKENEWARVAIEYRLKNGGSISREYYLTVSRGSRLHKLYKELSDCPEVQWHSVMGELSPAEIPALAGAFVQAWGGEEGDSVTLDAQQARQLYEALRSDLLAGRNAWDLFAPRDRELTVDIQFFLADGNQTGFSGSVYGLCSGCTETVNTLTALGLRQESLTYWEPEVYLEYTDEE